MLALNGLHNVGFVHKPRKPAVRMRVAVLGLEGCISLFCSVLLSSLVTQGVAYYLRAAVRPTLYGYVRQQEQNCFNAESVTVKPLLLLLLLLCCCSAATLLLLAGDLPLDIGQELWFVRRGLCQQVVLFLQLRHPRSQLAHNILTPTRTIFSY